MAICKMASEALRNQITQKERLLLKSSFLRNLSIGRRRNFSKKKLMTSRKMSTVSKFGIDGLKLRKTEGGLLSVTKFPEDIRFGSDSKKSCGFLKPVHGSKPIILPYKPGVPRRYPEPLCNLCPEKCHKPEPKCPCPRKSRGQFCCPCDPNTSKLPPCPRPYTEYPKAVVPKPHCPQGIHVPSVCPPHDCGKDPPKKATPCKPEKTVKKKIPCSK